jgi:hypothetical protein
MAYHLNGGCAPLPADVAGRECEEGKHKYRFVTWAEILDKRRKRQAEHLQRILFVPPPREGVVPCYVWVFFNPGFIYYGWYCYVITRQGDHAVNFRGFDSILALSIMRAIPLGMLPSESNFKAWMPAFAKAFPRPVISGRKRKDRRRAGSKVGWLKDESIFSVNRPEGKI